MSDDHLIPIPLDYAKSPIFAAKPTNEGRCVVSADGTEYMIGGNLLEVKNKVAPALDVRHGRLLLVLLVVLKRLEDLRS